jgi:hypothetical protein
MLGVEIKIATDAAFENIIYQSTITTTRTDFMLPDFNVGIEPDTTYYWSIRYLDEDGLTSPWSDPTSLTTASAFEPTAVLQPHITYPSEGARISPIDPQLMSSPFDVEGASDSHESSDWQLSRSVGFEAENILAESLDDTVNLTGITFGGLDLVGDNGFYARVRHKGLATPTKSSFSPIRHALLREFYDNPLIGVAFRRSSAGAQYVGRYIDINGNSVRLRSDYFNTHPLYLFSQITIADQVMATIPEVNVKCAADVAGDAYRFWISPEDFEGSYLHPAFAQSNGPIFCGVYLSGNETNADELTNAQGCSRPDRYVRVHTFWPPDIVEVSSPYANWLNTNEDSAHRGWHTDSIYDYALRELLMFIEFKSFSLGGIMSGIVNVGLANDPTRPKYRGITHPYITTAAMSDSWTGYALEGYEQYSHNPIKPFTIGYPSSLTTRKTMEHVFLVNQNGMSSAGVDTIRTGWDDDFECDIDLLFLPESEGVGTGNSVSSSYASDSGWECNNQIITQYSNGPFFDWSGVQTSQTVRKLVRISKWS